jgi:hypothetical protein
MEMKVEIPIGRKEFIEKNVAKLNKKAVKLGCQPVTLEFSEIREIELDDAHGHAYKAFVLDATLNYEIPIINGWELICRYDGFEGPDGVVIFTSKVPEKEIPLLYIDKKEIACEHCGINRFRNHSMLMHNVETGEYKEVGSTCIKDFFGHDPKGFMLFATYNFSDLFNGEEGESYEYNGMGYKRGCDSLTAVLTLTAACIQKFGWVSRKTADAHSTEYNPLTPTSSDVQFWADPKNWNDAKYRNDRPEVTEDHIALAAATIEYFKGVSPNNDYLMNCHKLAEIGMVPSRMIGVACSMVEVYRKEVLRIEKKKIEFKESNWVGVVGQKLIDIVVKCIYNTSVESQWGASQLYILVDGDGNRFNTFYNGRGWKMKQGDKGIMKGTVKAHDTYKGDKVTKMTRVNMTDITEEEK